jgi:tetratricopeptide (TPR) repeat protein
MLLRTLAGFSLVISISVSLSAQRGAGGRASSTGNATPDTPTSAPGLPKSLFLIGKVTVDDGTVLTEPVAVQSNCRGRIRTEGYTDAKGHFSLEINSLRDKQLAAAAQSTESSPDLQVQMIRGNTDGDMLGEWRQCELQAVLSGFTSQIIELSSRLTDFATVDVGTISLHRLATVEGATISATSANASPQAKKEFEKGRELQRKEKWDEALARYRQAVELYPKYATAWLELGRVQIKRGDLTAARNAFQMALAADPKFVAPYEELSQLAAKDKQWQHVIDLTGELLQLDPVSFPQYWYLNSAANFYLQQLDAAEKSALRGLEVDSQHKVPRLEYLLGLILAQKRDYPDALQRIQNYLRLAPHAADADVARKQLQELEKLSTAASVGK